MRLDDLTIALRPRAPWEATDLGIAIVRANSRLVYAAWVLVTLPLFVVLNLAGMLVGWIWIAPLVLWWLKPAFDRIPLFVISRTVFGDRPSLRDVLTAQRQWGWRAIAPWLLWRRFHPGRAMLLPVDLLEGSSGVQRSDRVRVLARGGGSPNIALTFVGLNLEAMLYVALLLLGLMFVPIEFLSDSAKAAWRMMVEHPTWWAQLLLNFCAWIAMTVIEPFYVGAGFGLYLNRRMQLEGWDIELAFRRIAVRLRARTAAAVATALILGVAVCAVPLRAVPAPEDSSRTSTHVDKPAEHHASAENPLSANEDAAATDCNCDHTELGTTLHDLFGDSYRDDGKAFDDAVDKAYDDVDLRPTRRAFVWKRRVPLADPAASAPPGWAMGVGSVVGALFKYGLWILLAIVLVLVAIHHRRWMPWIADRFVQVRTLDAVALGNVPMPEPLPNDVPAAVRELMRASRLREAMALLYRAGVRRLAESLGTPLPPGATEAECLRHAQKLRDAQYAALFTRIVRGWQSAAYAQQMPEPAAVEAMLVAWVERPQAAG